ncbi:ATP-binding protein [Peterkaempfera griseoplana]|uniref:ATP-binding protein n=1 Tax=Peterkaempfera griseoplana TaxID=66896 RepID=UPI0006E15E58|nr:ATP-binding protein [Peterkaempfera griseoplana]
MSQERIESLRRAVEASPDDTMLRLILAEALLGAGLGEQSLPHFEVLLHAGALPTESLLQVGSAALDGDRLDLARACLEAARHAGVVENVTALQRRVDERLAERSGADRLRVRADGADGQGGDPSRDDAGPESTTFDDVGGMAEVKKLIHRMVVLPRSRPELFAAYGRRTGGGVLLYGPPGCGKTLLARATAGECGLPFLNVRIEDVIDPYQGISERNLHHAFETARAVGPCVIFLDELDGLAYARHKHRGSEARRLVDVLLQELDAIGSDNSGLTVMAATNAPWDVDEAMLRPGRFDRVVFVPPPDEPARADILRVHTAGLPTGEGTVDADAVAARTALFSGADLRAVVERAVDELIEEALRGGGEPPLGTAGLLAAVDRVRPSTLEWLQRARAYVEFANGSERYEDVAAFLRTREVRRRLAKGE